MALFNKRGKISYLRAHDQGTGWGPPKTSLMLK